MIGNQNNLIKSAEIYFEGYSEKKEIRINKEIFEKVI